MMPEIFVFYFGSLDEYCGEVMRLLGICGCRRCAKFTLPRYRLAVPGETECAASCVRESSIQLLKPEQLAEFRAAQACAEIAEGAATAAVEDIVGDLDAELRELLGGADEA